MFGRSIKDWLAIYQGVTPVTPHAALSAWYQSLLTYRDDPAWILLFDWEQIASQLAKLNGRKPQELPLYGVPFVIKDNIHVVGVPTTAACPAFASMPDETAFAVQLLLNAGAVLVGKTNLDQFATGLVGTRSPYGAVPNAFDPAYISGGSSSGSARAVALGWVPFSLGTDTAGSGRVPAGLNNIVGLKPTPGWYSTRGVVPACRTLDCLSVFALDVNDAWTVAQVIGVHDDKDAYAQRPPARQKNVRLPKAPRLAIPETPEWFGDTLAEQCWLKTLEDMQALGAELVPTDFSVLYDIARFLYAGPWVAERYAVLENLYRRDPDAIHPVVRDIVAAAENISALQTFRARYELAEKSIQARKLLADVDAILVPTAPSIYRIDEVLDNPVELNSRMGRYTNFVNFMSWCALAVPAGLRDDGLPFGVTLIADSWRDDALADFAVRWQSHKPWNRGALPVPVSNPAVVSVPVHAHDERVQVAVVGAHLTGMPLNFQLLAREAVLMESTLTAPAYRLFALPDTTPPKPGLVRDANGSSIIVEVWEMPLHRFGEFVAEIPPPLGIGNLELVDGRYVKGFICEPWALQGARDITHLGGWRAFVKSLSATSDKTS